MGADGVENSDMNGTFRRRRHGKTCKKTRLFFSSGKEQGKEEKKKKNFNLFANTTYFCLIKIIFHLPSIEQHREKLSMRMEELMRKYSSPLQKQQLMVRAEHIVNGNDQNYPIENYVSLPCRRCLVGRSGKQKSLLKLVVAFDINSLFSTPFFSSLPTDPNMQSRDLERERESCGEVHRQIDMDFTRQI